jgi:hypothetical protein
MECGGASIEAQRPPGQGPIRKISLHLSAGSFRFSQRVIFL